MGHRFVSIGTNSNDKTVTRMTRVEDIEIPLAAPISIEKLNKNHALYQPICQPKL